MSRYFQTGAGGRSQDGVPYFKIFTKSNTWVVPQGLTEIDAFIVGGGGGSISIKTDMSGATGGGNGGGGYTKTFKNDPEGWRDGPAIPVTPGEVINIIVGTGGSAGSGGVEGNIAYPAGDGEYSEFKNSSYRAEGGKGSNGYSGGDGGSGGGAYRMNGGIDGDNGVDLNSIYTGGKGQGHTTRQFGEEDGGLYSQGGEIRNQENAGVIVGSGNGGNTWTRYPQYYSSGGSSGCIIIRGIINR